MDAQQQVENWCHQADDVNRNKYRITFKRSDKENFKSSANIEQVSSSHLKYLRIDFEEDIR